MQKLSRDLLIFHSSPNFSLQLMQSLRKNFRELYSFYSSIQRGFNGVIIFLLSSSMIPLLSVIERFFSLWRHIGSKNAQVVPKGFDTTVISQNGNSYTIRNNLSYYQCGASENHEHDNVEQLIICKTTSHQQMKEPQQVYGRYSPSQVGKCNNTWIFYNSKNTLRYSKVGEQQ